MRFRAYTAALLTVFVIACDREAREEPPPEQVTPVVDSTTNRPDTMPEKVSTPYTIPNDSMNVLVEINEKAVKVSHARVPAGTITFVLNNTGTVTHALEIKASYGGRWRSLPGAPGKQTTLQTGIMSGVYQVYCPLVHGGKEHADTKAQFIVD